MSRVGVLVMMRKTFFMRILAAYLHIVLRLRTSGAIRHLTHIFQCLAQGHINIFLYTLFQAYALSLGGKVLCKTSQRKLGTRNAYFNVALTLSYKSYFYKK